MRVDQTALSGVLVLESTVIADQRGFFLESWNSRDFKAAVGRSDGFVQDNHSRSRLGVIRGLHYQLEPEAQGKLVRVSRGAIFDVAVDIRRSSVTFGRWYGVELSDDNCRQLWIPAGFAHGFMSLVDGTDVIYKTTAYHSPEHERSIHWGDPTIGVAWPHIDDPVVSEKDANAPPLAEAEVFA